MKIRFTRLIPLILLAAPAIGYADDSAVRKEIQGMYDRMSAGFLKKDAQPMLDMLTPDFTNVEQNGQVQKRAEFEKQFKEMMKTVRKVEKSDLKVAKLALKKGAAVADVRTQMKVVMAGEPK